MTLDFCIAPSGQIKALYADTDLRKLLPAGSFRIVRNSVVEPISQGQGFVIRWLLPELQQLFGSVTTADEQGRPFLTHSQAVAEEVRLLRQHYFHLR